MLQILVATDFSERSNRAVRRARLLALELGARLLLLHVVDDDRPQRLVTAEATVAQELLDGIIDVALREVQCEAKVAFGDPFAEIAKVSLSEAVDLIVMGAHRKQILRDIFIGTSIERVARLRVAPVLMVNTEPAGPYQRSVVAVDLSEHSGRALQVARVLAMLPSSHVAVVHAFQVLAKGKMTYAEVAPDVITRHVEQTAQDARSEMARFLGGLGAEAAQYAVRIKEGRPVDIIIEVANAEQADIVVIGTHGRTALLTALLGSVSEEIMRTLDRDILIVPPKPQEATAK